MQNFREPLSSGQLAQSLLIWIRNYWIENHAQTLYYDHIHDRKPQSQVKPWFAGLVAYTGPDRSAAHYRNASLPVANDDKKYFQELQWHIGRE